ncbi:MAG: hypothetical protein HKM96_04100, partial [Boseongicola sp.]|nr:hypothetical protein [Boseongicola sp.]
MGTDRNWSALGAGLTLAVGMTGAAFAAEGVPLSAIDWLSDSIAMPQTSVAAPVQPHTATLPTTISVAPIDVPVADRAGLISARELGVPPGLWGRSAAADLAAALRALPDTSSAPPSLRGFLHDLLVVRLDPPIDATEDDSLYLARVDHLLEMGRLTSADRLIDAAGAPEPRRFRRAFDVALLTGTETQACKVIEETPEISPTYPARVFCLARGGQWDVAALTLGNAEALGILTPDEDALLLHFLDPELFEGEKLPSPPRLPTPLTFRLYEAVGERQPTDQLPVAFAIADLSDTVGWRTRLRAVERLAAVDAVSFERLLSVYSERAPAASGAIWDRVGAVQALVRAVEDGSSQKLARTLPEAWQVAKDAGYEAALAGWIASKLDGQTLDGTAGHAAFEIALLAGRPGLAGQFSAGTAEDDFLLAIATGKGTRAAGADQLGRAVLRGLSARRPGAQFQALVDDGRSGEALLTALATLMDGAAGNPDRTANAIAMLRSLGLERLA